MIKALKYQLIPLLVLALTCGEAFGQNARQMTRKGNKLYEEGKFTEAEVQYMKSLDTDENLFEAKFNMADAMFRQKKYDQAIEQWQILAGSTEEKEKLGRIYHNMGNAYVASENLEKSLESYKLSLRNNPADDETRYNLAFVQHQLNKQQQQQQQQNNDQKPPLLTEFAKKVKQQADELLAAGKFREAFQVMQEATQKDASMGNYKEYMGRLSKVAGIEE